MSIDETVDGVINDERGLRTAQHEVASCKNWEGPVNRAGISMCLVPTCHGLGSE